MIKNYFRKVDAFIGKWIVLIPMMFFDILIITMMCLNFLFGGFIFFFQSMSFGLFIIISGFLIGFYLIIKRNQK